MAQQNAVAPKTAGISLIDMQAQMAQMMAAMNALKTGIAATPAVPQAPTPEAKPVITSKKNGKVTHTSPEPAALAVTANFGFVESAEVVNGGLNLRIKLLPRGTEKSDSGKSYPNGSGNVVFSDGSKLNLCRFTPLKAVK